MKPLIVISMVLAMTMPAIASPHQRDPADGQVTAYIIAERGSTMCKEFDRNWQYAAKHLRNNQPVMTAAISADFCIQELVQHDAPQPALDFANIIKEDMCKALDLNGVGTMVSSCNEYY